MENETAQERKTKIDLRIKNRTSMKSKFFAGSVFILSIVLSVLFFVFRDFFKGSASLGLLGLFIINFVSSVTLFVSAPSIFAVVAGGSIYPPFLVALVSSLGSTLGEGLSFLFGLSGRHLIKHKLEKKIWFRVLEDYFKKYGGIILFLFTLIPNPLFDSMGIIAGLFKYPICKFFLIFFLGRFIRYFFLAQFGSRF